MGVAVLCLFAVVSPAIDCGWLRMGAGRQTVNLSLLSALARATEARRIGDAALKVALEPFLDPKTPNPEEHVLVNAVLWCAVTERGLTPAPRPWLMC